MKTLRHHGTPGLPYYVMDEASMLPHFGNRFDANQAVQRVYEVGRTCGTTTTVQDVMCMKNLIGVFHIR